MRRDTEVALLERFARLQAEGSTDLAASAAWCGAEQYASADQLEREVDTMFRRGPVVVGLTPDAAEPGDWFTADVVGFPVVVVRGADRRLRAFANVCAHRGSRMVDGRGTARRAFTCGFHAWSFERDTGCLLGTPRSCGGFDQLDPAGTGLTPVGVAEVGGVIFVQPIGTDAEAESGALARLGDARGELDAFGIGRFHRHDSRSFELACNYKLAMDTFCESYHIATLHRTTIAPDYYSAPALSQCYGDTTLMVGVRTTLAAELERPLDEQRLLPHATTQYLIAPNGMLSFQLDHFQMWTIDPVAGDPGRCSLRVTAYAPDPIDERWARKLDKNLDLLLQVTRTEDFPRCEETQRAMASGALRRLTFGRNEPALITYHQAIDRLAGSSHVQLVEVAQPATT